MIHTTQFGSTSFFCIVFEFTTNIIGVLFRVRTAKFGVRNSHAGGHQLPVILNCNSGVSCDYLIVYVPLIFICNENAEAEFAVRNLHARVQQLVVEHG